MANLFLEQLDISLLRTLAKRTALDGAALMTVGPTLRIESMNSCAESVIRLHPLERIDQILSASAAAALRDCLANRNEHTLREELDGIEYCLVLLPYRDGALVAYLRDDRAEYDGTLRVFQVQGRSIVGQLVSAISCVTDPETAAAMHKQCLRIYRLLSHADFLHDTLLLEQLPLSYQNIAALCSKAAKQTMQHIKNAVKIKLSLPAKPPVVLIEPQLFATALFNLLTNAVRVSPKGQPVLLSLRDDEAFITITVSDRGPGLSADLLDRLTSAWRQTVSLEQYLDFKRQGTSLGLGLPLVQQIAQLYGGSLLFSPREGGGSDLHFTIARLPDSLASDSLHAPIIPPDPFPLEDIELSCLD